MLCQSLCPTFTWYAINDFSLVLALGVHEKSMLYAYSVKQPIRELNLKRALDEDTGVFSSFFSFFSFLSSSSPLGQTAVSGNSTLHPGSFRLLLYLDLL